MSASIAEFTARRIDLSALGTSTFQLKTATTTKPGIFRIFMLTARALHLNHHKIWEPYADSVRTVQKRK